MTDGDTHIDSVFATIVQRREDICVMKENMAVTTMMRIYEIIDFKRQMEATAGKQSKNSLASQYAKVKFAKGTEPVKSSYIEVCPSPQSSRF